MKRLLMLATVATLVAQSGAAFAYGPGIVCWVTPEGEAVCERVFEVAAPIAAPQWIEEPGIVCRVTPDGDVICDKVI